LISFTFAPTTPLDSAEIDVVSDARSYGAGTLTMSGSFGYDAGVVIEKITLLGVGQARKGSPPEGSVYDSESGTLTYNVNAALTGGLTMQVGWNKQ
jgi:hypothetical protein